MDLKCSHLDTPLGPILLAASDQGLAGAWFDGQQHMPNFEGWKIDRQNPHLKQAARELTDYFSGARAPFKVTLSAAWGTAFQQAVWQALQGIGFGSTTCYSEVASQAGRPKAVRAAGAAIGLPLESEPELIERLDVAALTACWYWSVNRLNSLADDLTDDDDDADFEAITRKINGGTTGLVERRALWKVAKGVLG